MAESDLRDLTERLQTLLENRMGTFGEGSTEQDYIRFLSEIRALRVVATRLQSNEAHGLPTAAIETALRDLAREMDR